MVFAECEFAIGFVACVLVNVHVLCGRPQITKGVPEGKAFAIAAVKCSARNLYLSNTNETTELEEGVPAKWSRCLKKEVISRCPWRSRATKKMKKEDKSESDQ
ncbi:expressed unknown protein [Seminavis robusta]|uniref:Uncharacterized protein n=1 Tax=Seminavis robusta TaxID=568900 RepID=A0A9N8EBL1_9STRA|nr:expressed unknown protein [Seminavis robusta]|eukprot:Sro907_g218800.1 n/a (103) ;mRNA; f:32461-32769